jgi:hypothetical protein
MRAKAVSSPARAASSSSRRWVEVEAAAILIRVDARRRRNSSLGR